VYILLQPRNPLPIGLIVRFVPFLTLLFRTACNRKSGGYGLGFSIVKRIAVAHKGTVSVAESPMWGARFTLCWPKNLSSVAR